MVEAGPVGVRRSWPKAGWTDDVTKLVKGGRAVCSLTPTIVPTRSYHAGLGSTGAVCMGTAWPRHTGDGKTGPGAWERIIGYRPFALPLLPVDWRRRQPRCPPLWLRSPVPRPLPGRCPSALSLHVLWGRRGANRSRPRRSHWCLVCVAPWDPSSLPRAPYHTLPSVPAGSDPVLCLYACHVLRSRSWAPSSGLYNGPSCCHPHGLLRRRERLPGSHDEPREVQDRACGERQEDCCPRYVAFKDRSKMSRYPVLSCIVLHDTMPYIHA